jgi:hypothetical protein
MVVQPRAERNQNKGGGKEKGTKRRKSDQLVVSSNDQMGDADRKHGNLE